MASPRKLVLELLGDALKAHAPSGLRTAREFSARLGGRQRPEPDLMLVRAEAFAKLEQAWFSPEAVELAVEVVSPESVTRDRERKPRLYARAGVPFFWRAEQEGDDAVVHEYERDPTSPSGDYRRPTVHREKFTTSVPLSLGFDLTDVLRR
nr:Uma2 family endonuclease [Nocardiopsis sp. TSRI0078]